MLPNDNNNNLKIIKDDFKCRMGLNAQACVKWIPGKVQCRTMQVNKTCISMCTIDNNG